jgi:putative membrane protein
MLQVIVASLHLIALGLGLGAVLTRGNLLREPITASSLRRAFRADTLWGIAAALWIVTGLWRLFGGFEKGVPYYTHNTLFMAKMTFLILILLIEIGPAITLVRWRIALLKKGQPPESVAPVHAAKRIAMLSHMQALLVVLMVFAAAGMARGLGMGVSG